MLYYSEEPAFEVGLNTESIVVSRKFALSIELEDSFGKEVSVA